MGKKKKVYFQMFLAYVAILAIPILIGMVIYSYTYRITKNQGERMNLNMLELVQSEMELKMDGISKMAQRLALDASVQNISRKKGTLDADDRYRMYELYRNLNNYNITDELVSDIFVYFNNVQTISSINGTMTPELYYGLYLESDKYSFDDFREYMSEPHYKDTLLLYRKDGSEVLLFTMTNLDTGMWDPSATVTVLLDVSGLQKMLGYLKWDSDMDLLVIDKNNNMIVSGEENKYQEVLDYAQLKGEDYKKIVISGKNCIVTLKDSRTLGWKYVTVIPEALFERNAKKIQNCSVLGLFACILIGFGGSYFFTKRNYNPVKSLLDIFGGFSKENIGEDENEFQWLKHQTEQFFQKHMNAEKLLSDNRKNLKNYYLTQLLEYTYEGKRQDLERYGIELGKESCMVILFQFKTADKMEEAAQAAENSLQKFIVTNVFSEMILEHFKIEMAELGERLAAIIRFPENNSAYEEMIRECAENLLQLTEEKFGFSVTVLMGACGEGRWGIHSSYMQAKELGEYIPLLEENILVYSDVRNTAISYAYPMEMEQKIINALKSGDSEKAKKFIRQVFDNNFSGKVSVNVVRCLVFEMLGTMLKGADAGGSGESSGHMDVQKLLATGTTLEEIEEMFEKTAEEICSDIAEERKINERDNSLSKRIDAYILENYSNPDLNISITGQYFGITPSYLSSIYKKQTGKSLLSYINTVRMDRAEELLMENYSVVEVAGMVGFRDSATFIRAFKRAKGITPGQMKRNLQ